MGVYRFFTIYLCGVHRGYVYFTCLFVQGEPRMFFTWNPLEMNCVHMFSAIYGLPLAHVTAVIRILEHP